VEEGDKIKTRLDSEAGVDLEAGVEDRGYCRIQNTGY